MTESDQVAALFEAERPRLRAVAVRLLGSTGDADDAVQEAWLRLNRTGAAGVDNLGGWLTTVVARIALDMLRGRGHRRESSLDDHPGPPGVAGGPEDEAELADSIGAALLVVLDTLSPAERMAFVLHDLFAVPFEEIAPIVGRTPVATRQLASRARRQVRGGEPGEADRVRQREVVSAFLAASRNGEFDRLIALLEEGAVLRADSAAVRMGAQMETMGRLSIAETFSGRARHAHLAMIDGRPGAVWTADDQILVAFDFTVVDGLIAGIELLADPETIDQLEVVTDVASDVP